MELEKINAEKIKELEKQIKGAFKEKQYDSAKKSIEELVKIDPKNSLSAKFLTKIEKIMGESEEKKVSEEESVGDSNQVESKTENVFMAKEEVMAEDAKPAKTKVQVIEPVTPIVPVITPVQVTDIAAAPAKAETAIIKPVAEKTAEPITSDETAGGRGNVFTRMFKGKEELETSSKSIIDTIVEKSSASKKPVAIDTKQSEKKEKGEGVGFLKFSKAFMQFSIAFIVLSAGFFYVQNIDINNTVLGLFNVEENYASRLHAANTMLEAKTTEEDNIIKENNRYQQGYNNRYEDVIKQIIDNRLNWPDILAKINEVADFIYERNAISQYIKFNSFSFDAEKKLITVSGSLSDPLGKNLTKMAELEEAFRYYPKDKTNPEDTVKPYFSDFKEFKSLSKSFDKNTGKYTSTFQLSFTLNPENKQ